MDENRIDEIIGQLFKIEAAAVGIQNDTETEKDAYSKLMEQKTKEYAENLERDTGDKLEKLRQQLNESKALEMTTMRNDILNQTTRMDELYEENHEQWTRDIVESILKE